MTNIFQAVSTGAVLALVSTIAQADAQEMRCSHQLPPSHAVAQVIDRWAAEVETLSNGEIDVQIFGANSLVGAKENIISTAKGDIECAFSVQFQWGRTLPIMTVTTAPYAFSDMNIWRNWDGSEAANFLEDQLRDKGLENVVWVFQTNSSVFTSNDHPLIAPSDFEGMKLRGLVPAFNAALEALGASPVSMSGSEVYQSLATGVIDGGFTGIGAAHSRNYHEVQDYFTVVPVISVFFHGYVNPEFYAGLSDVSKAALDEAGAKAAIWAIEAAEKNDAGGAEALRAEGATVHIATEAENAALEAIMRPAYDAVFGAENEDSKKLLDLIEQLREEQG